MHSQIQEGQQPPQSLINRIDELMASWSNLPRDSEYAQSQPSQNQNTPPNQTSVKLTESRLKLTTTERSRFAKTETFQWCPLHQPADSSQPQPTDSPTVNYALRPSLDAVSLPQPLGDGAGVTREQIDRLEDAMRPLAAAAPPQYSYRHFFAPGVYVREMIMAAGCTFTSKIHKYETVGFITYGDVTVASENGVERITVRAGDAPRYFVTKPGTKRALYIHADTMWTVIHVNADNDTDMGTLEAKLTADTHEEFDRYLEHK